MAKIRFIIIIIIITVVYAAGTDCLLIEEICSSISSVCVSIENRDFTRTILNDVQIRLLFRRRSLFGDHSIEWFLLLL